MEFGEFQRLNIQEMAKLPRLMDMKFKEKERNRVDQMDSVNRRRRAVLVRES
jgi:hypothetical protein